MINLFKSNKIVCALYKKGEVVTGYSSRFRMHGFPVTN